MRRPTSNNLPNIPAVELAVQMPDFDQSVSLYDWSVRKFYDDLNRRSYYFCLNINTWIISFKKNRMLCLCIFLLPCWKTEYYINIGQSKPFFDLCITFKFWVFAMKIKTAVNMLSSSQLCKAINMSPENTSLISN